MHSLRAMPFEAPQFVDLNCYHYHLFKDLVIIQESETSEGQAAHLLLYKQYRGEVNDKRCTVLTTKSEENFKASCMNE